jgi:hypothetical protein
MKATIIFNEVDDYAECVIDGEPAKRFQNVYLAAAHAGLQGAAEFEVKEIDCEHLEGVLFWFQHGLARRAKQEATAAKQSRAAFYGPRAQRNREMGRNRFGRFRGLAREY